jgi:DNA primase catalytic subunit
MEIGEKTLATFGYPPQLDSETGAEYTVFKLYLEAGSLADLQKILTNDATKIYEVDSAGKRSVVTYSRARQLNETREWQRRKREYKIYVATEVAKLQAEATSPELTSYALTVKSKAVKQLEIASQLLEILDARMADIYEVNVKNKNPKHPDYIPAEQVPSLLSMASRALDQSRDFYERALGVQELQKAVNQAIKVSGNTPGLSNSDTESE